MNTNSVSQSGFVARRSFLPRSLILLALVALVAFPAVSAWARPKCDPVVIYYEYGGPTGVLVGMDTDTPAPRTILYTTNGSNPTHDYYGNPGPGTYIFYGDIPIPYLHCVNFKALCFKAYPYVDSDITYENVCNPVQ
jgi:hypothetical protein